MIISLEPALDTKKHGGDGETCHKTLQRGGSDGSLRIGLGGRLVHRETRRQNTYLVSVKQGRYLVGQMFDSHSTAPAEPIKPIFRIFRPGRKPMHFSIHHPHHFNHWAVLVSALILWFLGACWYSPVLFAKPWMAALGIVPGHAKKGLATGMISSFIGDLFVAFAAGKSGCF
jgi:hypothetical protein